MFEEPRVRNTVSSSGPLKPKNRHFGENFPKLVIFGDFWISENHWMGSRDDISHY